MKAIVIFVIGFISLPAFPQVEKIKAESKSNSEKSSSSDSDDSDDEFVYILFDIVFDGIPQLQS
ncbi:MAG: hypothetical protein OEU76_04940, partial [Cyclobacteriaceae bacterium]|nr:hypothetical protein [Cyclobacteriaceae bacterium]